MTKKPRHSGFSDVLVGLQYGDEGKARIIDTIADNYDVIARFNGGSNAGHTVEYDNKKIALHQVPSGIFYEDKILYIGSGCVVNPVKLIDEIAEIKNVGISLEGRFHISGLASLVQPHHVVIDRHTGTTIGTTGQGIGPAYTDRAKRIDGQRLINLRIGDLLFDPNKVFRQAQENLAHTVEKYKLDNVDENKLMQEFASAAGGIIRYIEADTLFMSKLANQGKRILFEGAQSFMLDVVKGSVPFVTSSSTVASAAYVGGDLPPKFHRKTIGVVKAIMSRVGWGPFVSEFGGPESENYCMTQPAGAKEREAQMNSSELLSSEYPFNVGVALRFLGNEYGATTGRPRRVGALDLVQLSYAAAVNGVDELYINKCDLLADFSKTHLGTIPVVAKYLFGEKEIDYIPSSSELYRSVTPQYSQFAAFSDDVSNIRNFSELPKELVSLVQHIEENICPVRGLGVGPRRDQFVRVDHALK